MQWELAKPGTQSSAADLSTMLSLRLARPAIARPVAPRLRVRPAARSELAQRAVAVRLSAKDLLGAKSGASRGELSLG